MFTLDIPTKLAKHTSGVSVFPDKGKPILTMDDNIK